MQHISYKRLKPLINDWFRGEKRAGSQVFKHVCPRLVAELKSNWLCMDNCRDSVWQTPIVIKVARLPLKLLKHGSPAFVSRKASCSVKIHCLFVEKFISSFWVAIPVVLGFFFFKKMVPQFSFWCKLLSLIWRVWYWLTWYGPDITFIPV